jgi:hypothetical protein
MPCGDVPGRVHISVADVSAVRAAEQRLALAAVRCDVAARRALLAGKHGVDFLDPTWSLIHKSAIQQAPPRGEDAAVQPGLLPDATARSGGCAVGRARHAADPQVLYADHVEPAGQARRRLLGPVPAPITFASLQFRDRLLEPTTSAGTIVGAGQPAFHSPKPRLFLWTQRGTLQQFAGGQSSRHRHTSVDANNFASAGARNRRGYDSERDMPASSSVASDTVGACCLHGAGPSEAYPSCLGDPDFASVAGQPPDVSRLDRDDSESLVATFLAPAGPAVGTAEVIHHGLGEIPQRLLLHHLAALGQPAELSASLCQLCGLCVVSGSAAAPGPPPGLLLDRQIPNVTGVAAVPGQDDLLRGRWCQPVAGHKPNLVATSDIPSAANRRFVSSLPGQIRTLRIQ